MSTSMPPARPLASLKQALRRCRAERQRGRNYATAPISQTTTLSPMPPVDRPPREQYPSLLPRQYNVSKKFRPSQAIKQNRFEQGLKKIRTYPPPRSTLKICPDPIDRVYRDQLAQLDPTGARTRLFSYDNVDRVQPGDILHVRFKSGDPYSGVCLNIRKRNSPIDTAVLLRNQLTRVSVEMWVKVYSPNVEGIEIVQRKAKRARRAKLYYMRNPKHDMGSVENIVKQYVRQKMGGASMSGKSKGRGGNSKGRGGNGNLKKKKKVQADNGS